MRLWLKLCTLENYFFLSSFRSTTVNLSDTGGVQYKPIERKQNLLL